MGHFAAEGHHLGGGGVQPARIVVADGAVVVSAPSGGEVCRVEVMFILDVVTIGDTGWVNIETTDQDVTVRVEGGAAALAALVAAVAEDMPSVELSQGTEEKWLRRSSAGAEVLEAMRAAAGAAPQGGGESSAVTPPGPAASPPPLPAPPQPPAPPAPPPPPPPPAENADPASLPAPEDNVEVFDGNYWYPATVKKVRENGTYDIVWEDGGEKLKKVAPEHVRPRAASRAKRKKEKKDKRPKDLDSGADGASSPASPASPASEPDPAASQQPSAFLGRDPQQQPPERAEPPAEAAAPDAAGAAGGGDAAGAEAAAPPAAPSPPPAGAGAGAAAHPGLAWAQLQLGECGRRGEVAEAQEAARGGVAAWQTHEWHLLLREPGQPADAERARLEQGLRHLREQWLVQFPTRASAARDAVERAEEFSRLQTVRDEERGFVAVSLAMLGEAARAAEAGWAERERRQRELCARCLAEVGEGVESLSRAASLFAAPPQPGLPSAGSPRRQLQSALELREAGKRSGEAALQVQAAIERARSAVDAPGPHSEWHGALGAQLAALQRAADCQPPCAAQGKASRRAMQAHEYPTLAGWVLKADSTFTSWHRRYMVLSLGRLLQMCHEHDPRPKELCHVDSLRAVELDTYRATNCVVPPVAPHQRNSLGFYAETGSGQRFRFCCYSLPDRQCWMGALRRAIEVAQHGRAARDGVDGLTYRAARRRQETHNSVLPVTKAPHTASTTPQGGCRSLTTPPDRGWKASSVSPDRSPPRRFHGSGGSAQRASAARVPKSPSTERE